MNQIKKKYNISNINGKKIDNLIKIKNYYSKNTKYPINIDSKSKEKKIKIFQKKLSQPNLNCKKEKHLNKITTRKFFEDKIKRKKSVSNNKNKFSNSKSKLKNLKYNTTIKKSKTNRNLIKLSPQKTTKNQINNKISYSKNKINKKYTISINMKNFDKKQKKKDKLEKTVNEINSKVNYLIKDIKNIIKPKKSTKSKKKKIKKKKNSINKNKIKIQEQIEKEKEKKKEVEIEKPINENIKKFTKDQYNKWNNFLHEISNFKIKKYNKSFEVKLENLKDNIKKNIKELETKFSKNSNNIKNKKKKIIEYSNEKWYDFNYSKISSSINQISNRPELDIINSKENLANLISDSSKGDDSQINIFKNNKNVNSIINKVNDNNKIWINKIESNNETNTEIINKNNIIDKISKDIIKEEKIITKSNNSKNNNLSQLKIDLIQNFIWEEWLEDILNKNLYIKLFLPSNYIKGIRTNNNYVKIYLNKVIEYLKKDYNTIIHVFNTSLGPNQLDRLKFYHNYQDNDSEGDNINYLPVIDLNIYFELEKEFGKQYESESNQLDLMHIHNKMLFDVLNESLDTYRIWNIKGVPIGIKYYNKIIKINKLDKIIKSAFDKCIFWANYLVGFIPLKNDPEMNLPILFEEDALNQIKEEKLYKIVFEDDTDDYKFWFNLEDELLEIKIEISDEILENLLLDSSKFLFNNNF